MNLFSTTPSQRQLGLALLLLRLALGAVFIAHGGQKLFTFGPSGTGEMLVKMGIPAANLIGPVLSVVEPLAAVGVLLGLLTRLAGLAIAIDMLGAILTFHIRNGFFVPAGVEFVMMNCAVGIALAILGAGPYSVDHAIEQRRERGAP
jgi:putative oxidoreductase